MKRVSKMLMVLCFSLLFISVNAFSEKISVDGTIKGANCVINKTYCAEDGNDPHLALENTFVLVDDAGSYYFMAHLGKLKKMAWLNKKIHVEGNKNGKLISVTSVYNVKSNNVMSKIWDWDEIREDLSR